MLALFAWSGLAKPPNHTKQHTKKVPCFAKLGGRYVGDIVVNNKSLMDLNVQAAKLMVHAWRAPVDVVLWVGDQCLTPSGFTHEDDDYWDSWIEQVLEQAKRVDMMWDESKIHDQSSLKAYSRRPCMLGLLNQENYLHIKVLEKWAKFPLELASLCNKLKIKTIKCKCVGNFTANMEFLRYAPSVKELCLELVTPTKWSCLKHVESLELDMTSIPCEFVGLDNLRRLVVKESKGFANVPMMKNLREVEFIKMNSSLEAIFASLVDMPKLERLVIKDAMDLPGRLPSTLGLLTGLKQFALVWKYYNVGDDLRNNYRRDVFTMLPNLEKLVLS